LLSIKARNAIPHPTSVPGHFLFSNDFPQFGALAMIARNRSRATAFLSEDQEPRRCDLGRS